jgi:hypothetical protein
LKPLNEDHLLVVIDYFIDFANNVFLLGYDLRIDAYSYCQFPLHYHFEALKYNSIYRIQKNVLESNLDSKTTRTLLHTHYHLGLVTPDELNPIEKIYFTHYNKKQTTILSDDNENPLQLRIHTGSVVETKALNSAFGRCLDLVIKSSELKESIITRTQDLTYKTNDKVSFLLKQTQSSQGNMISVLGLKPKDEVNLYLNSEYLELKNRQIKWVDYR